MPKRNLIGSAAFLYPSLPPAILNSAQRWMGQTVYLSCKNFIDISLFHSKCCTLSLFILSIFKIILEVFVSHTEITVSFRFSVPYFFRVNFSNRFFTPFLFPRTKISVPFREFSLDFPFRNFHEKWNSAENGKLRPSL